MSGASAAKFLRPSDVGAGLDVVFVAPFRAFANGARGPVEMVFAVVPFVKVEHLSTHNALFAVAEQHARPVSFKICGEGWIRLEQQLGRDMLTWVNRAVTLAHMRKGEHDYVGVLARGQDERAERFGRFA